MTEAIFSNTQQDVFRVDAEYFGKIALSAIARLNAIGAKPLIELAEAITDGVHTSLPFLDDGEIKVLSAKHPKDNFIDTSHFETVSLGFHENNPRTALRENDVLLTTVGTIGNSAVVTKDILPANSDRHIGIIRINPEVVAPHFLSTFLVSRYGRIQSTRETTGNVQPNLFISKIGRLLIPRFSRRFEQAIVDAVRLAYAARKNAADQLVKAELSLLSALGLETWTPPEALTYVRSAKEAFDAGRLDSEFFDPAAHAIEQLVTRHGALPLKELSTIRTGFPWNNEKFIECGVEGGEPFVRIRDCKPGSLSPNELDSLESEYAKALNQPEATAGDLVIGMDGLRWFYASQLLDSCYVNQRVGWLAPTDSNFSAEYLLTVINSLVGQKQLLARMTIAHTVGHITLENLREIRIPICSEIVREQITENVKTSFREKQRANILLKSAKRAVEIAIETSEIAAMTFLSESN